MKRLILSLLMLSALSAMAQGPSELLTERLLAQEDAWPREKLYIMPSSEEYRAGDIVWLKVYVVDASYLWNISGSRYVYVELADPSKKVRTRVKLQERDGLYAGYLRIPKEAGDGIYYLRAYTRFSETTPGSEALRPIQVGRPKAYVRETVEKKVMAGGGSGPLCPVGLHVSQTADSCQIFLNISALSPGEIADLSLSVSRSFHPLGEDILETLSGSKPEKGENMTAVSQDHLLDPPRTLETCQVLEGHVESAFAGKPAAGAEIRLISPQSGRFAIVRSDRNGRFRFDGLDDPEGTEYVINAISAAGKENVVPIVDEPAFPAFPSIPYRFREVMDTVSVEYGGIDIAETVELEGISITADVKKKEFNPMSAMANHSMDAERLEEIGASTLKDALYHFPGVRFDWIKGKQVCFIGPPSSIETKNPAAIAIDGIILDGMYDLDFIEMPIVERIDIFKGGNTVIWGYRGGSGVISITTKKGDYIPGGGLSEDRFNVRKVRPLGYQRPVLFRPDVRTLYWNPSIRSENLSFPLSGQKGTWRVVLQGVTSQGRIVDEVAELVIE